MKDKLKQILESVDPNGEIFNETAQDNFVNLIESKINEKVDTALAEAAEEHAVKLNEALEAQDADYAAKLETVLEHIDNDHTEKLEAVLESVDADHTEKLEAVLEHIDTDHAEKLETVLEHIDNDHAEKLEAVLEHIDADHSAKLQEVIGNGPGAVAGHPICIPLHETFPEPMGRMENIPKRKSTDPAICGWNGKCVLCRCWRGDAYIRR